MHLRRAGLSGGLGALLVLMGCATPPPAAVPGDLISGRLLLRVASDTTRPAQNVSAAFELQGTANQGELRLLSPLGSQVAAARWAPDSVTLQTSSGVQRFANLDELAREALGESLPLAALPDWLAGRPWPRAAHQTNAQGFEQAGWQVLLAQRADGIIEARRLQPPEVLLRVRLDSAP